MFGSRARFVVVESCSGVNLASAELRFSEMNMRIDELTLYPPAAP